MEERGAIAGGGEKEHGDGGEEQRHGGDNISQGEKYNVSVPLGWGNWLLVCGGGSKSS